MAGAAFPQLLPARFVMPRQAVAARDPALGLDLDVVVAIRAPVDLELDVLLEGRVVEGRGGRA